MIAFIRELGSFAATKSTGKSDLGMNRIVKRAAINNICEQMASVKILSGRVNGQRHSAAYKK
jgi:hypothetical protein